MRASQYLSCFETLNQKLTNKAKFFGILTIFIACFKNKHISVALFRLYCAFFDFLLFQISGFVKNSFLQFIWSFKFQFFQKMMFFFCLNYFVLNFRFCRKMSSRRSSFWSERLEPKKPSNFEAVKRSKVRSKARTFKILFSNLLLLRVICFCFTF